MNLNARGRAQTSLQLYLPKAKNNANLYTYLIVGNR